MVTDKLELAETIECERVHHLNAKQNSPIVARCSFSTDNENTIKKKRKLKGCGVFVGGDFSAKMREV